MLCRVADSLFWMSRYIERADNAARLVDVYLQFTLELERNEPDFVRGHWEPILTSTGDLELFYTLYDKINHITVPEFLTFNPKNPSSVLSCILSARENARQIRDQISSEMWNVINRLYMYVRSADVRKVWSEDPAAFYQRIREFSHLFNGLTADTYPHLDEHAMLACGRYLERADKTGRILDVKYHLLLPDVNEVGGSVDTFQWIALLRACSAMEAYHNVYVMEVVPHNVIDLLVLAEEFPRSIRFCVDRLDRNLHRLTGCPRTHFSNLSEQLCGRLLSQLSYQSRDEIIQFGLHEYLGQVDEQLIAIAKAIHDNFLFFPIVDPAAEAKEHSQENA